ncbi:MAG: hypothetical protein KME10_07495 [Plectolyngbya sp. WJT66-NPBG17]|jgi:hypothetical protein|nr:hypothetical protein [Plectolyngbya sp. WJT66-NPBG17]MBW4525341.1 hypothetical protein [Phormidium tanganyikae FI6-MK23]
MKNDEAISEIRRIRHTISEEHGHDPQALVNYYIELQKRHPKLAQQQSNQSEPLTLDDRSKVR